MAIDVTQKIISGEGQPSGGEGITGIAGARGLGASGTLITELHGFGDRYTAGGSGIVSPFPPLKATEIDQSIDVMFDRLKDRFDDYNTYSA